MKFSEKQPNFDYSYLSQFLSELSKPHMDGKLMRYRIQPCLWFSEITQVYYENQGTKFQPTKIGFQFSLILDIQWL
jgi:hypothetical protein